MAGRLGLLVAVASLGLASCTQPEFDRIGTWKPTGANDQNLRAMLVNPRDVYGGTSTITSRGDSGSRAVTRLLTDKRRGLLDASASHVAPTSTAPADPGLPSGGGGGSSGGTQ